jgi:hypothetical protein
MKLTFDMDAGNARPLCLAPAAHGALAMPARRAIIAAERSGQSEGAPTARLGKLERIALGCAAIGHVALIALMSTTFADEPPVPGTPMQVTFFDPGLPSFGDPNGNDAPPRPSTETVAPVDTQPVPAPETTQPTDAEAAAPSDEAAVSEVPPEPTPAEVPPKPAEAPAQATSRQSQQTNVLPVMSPSDEVGTGSLAIGATTHGDAKGLDPSLAAVVGQAVATRMRACWNPPTSGVRRDTASILIVRYAADGTLAGEPEVTRIINQQPVPVKDLNGYEASAVDALKRCSPVGLAPVLYPYWREVEVQLFGAPSVG